MICVESKCVKVADTHVLEIMSFVICLGSKCLECLDFKSSFLASFSCNYTGRTICDRARSQTGNDFPISVFAMVHEYIFLDDTGKRNIYIESFQTNSCTRPLGRVHEFV